MEGGKETRKGNRLGGEGFANVGKTWRNARDARARLVVRGTVRDHIHTRRKLSCGQNVGLPLIIDDIRKMLVRYDKVKWVVAVRGVPCYEPECCLGRGVLKRVEAQLSS